MQARNHHDTLSVDVESWLERLLVYFAQSVFGIVLTGSQRQIFSVYVHTRAIYLRGVP